MKPSDLLSVGRSFSHVVSWTLEASASRPLKSRCSRAFVRILLITVPCVCGRASNSILLLRSTSVLPCAARSSFQPLFARARPLPFSRGADSILFMAVLVYTVLSSPLLLLGLSVLAGAWAYCFILTKPEDPVHIAGYELRRREKVRAVCERAAAGPASRALRQLTARRHLSVRTNCRVAASRAGALFDSRGDAVRPDQLALVRVGGDSVHRRAARQYVAAAAAATSAASPATTAAVPTNPACSSIPCASPRPRLSHTPARPASPPSVRRLPRGG